jgi:hypothetical protein
MFLEKKVFCNKKPLKKLFVVVIPKDFVPKMKNNPKHQSMDHGLLLNSAALRQREEDSRGQQEK